MQIIIFAFKYFPVTLFVLSVIFAIFSILKKKLFTPNTIVSTLLNYFMFFNIGINYLFCFIIHSYFFGSIANLIGWQGSMFELQVGFACLAYGVTGIFSFWMSWAFKFAALISSGVFLIGVTIIHFYFSYFKDTYLAANAGNFFLIDLIIYAFGVILLFLQYSINKNYKFVINKT